LFELTKLLVQKQNELTNYVNIGKLNLIAKFSKIVNKMNLTPFSFRTTNIIRQNKQIKAIISRE
jgi:hypothetical protein